MCNRYRLTEAQIALAARYGVAAPFPPDRTISPPELFPDKPAYVVRHENGAQVLVGGEKHARSCRRLGGV